MLKFTSNTLVVAIALGVLLILFSGASVAAGLLSMQETARLLGRASVVILGLDFVAFAVFLFAHAMVPQKLCKQGSR